MPKHTPTYTICCEVCKEEIEISAVEFDVFCANPTPCPKCLKEPVIKLTQSSAEELGCCYRCDEPLNDDGICENHV